MPLVKQRRSSERRDRLNARNEKIRAYYSKEWARGFRTAKIIADLGETYALDAYTLEAIVFKKGPYKDF